MSLVLFPLTLREAQAYIERHHRHHGKVAGAKFCIGLANTEGAIDEGGVVGVAVVGRPVARNLDDGWTAEVLRVATDGTDHACSKLYAACWRAARAMGYQKLITYTLTSESGSSLRAAGWKCIGEAGGGSWSRKSRPRVDTHPTQTKLRWEVDA